MFEKNATICFQGDSITDGGRGRDGDLNHTMGHGYAYLIASRVGYEQPEQQYNFLNRGISGNRIVDLYARWQEDTLNLKPDVLSILIGVNDVGMEFSQACGVSAAKYEKVYTSLIDETKSQFPNITIVICEPFILPVGYVKDNWKQWYQEVSQRQEAAKRISEAYGTIYVPLQESFNDACRQADESYWIWDGVHPTPAGHALIANQWLDNVMNRK
ncbi:lysophospholipase [Paenibacillus macquariensis subsp. defensor]|nr:lysophospholipase [Paenibacillus macquariensis subsp. defensor]